MTLSSIQTAQQIQQFNARYIVECILDSHGIGEVALAMDTQLNQPVVIKVLREPLVDSVEMHQAFNQAIKLRTALGGEHIAKVLDSGINAEGFPFYVMEYLQGESLKMTLQRDQTLPIQQSLSIAIQICVALEAAHQRKFQTVYESDEQFTVEPHDLRPSNIFLIPTVTGTQVTLLDCGITKQLRNFCREAPTESVQKVLPGTFQYAAPEQLELGKETTNLADIYVLGMILYEMLSGTDPFGLGLNARLVGEVSWVHAHAFRSPRSLQALLGDSQTTVLLSEIVSKCLSKNPDHRYTSVQALRQVLEQVQVGESSLQSIEDTPPPGQLTSPQVQANEVHLSSPECLPDISSTQPLERQRDKQAMIPAEHATTIQADSHLKTSPSETAFTQRFSFAFDKTENANLNWPPFPTDAAVGSNGMPFTPLSFKRQDYDHCNRPLHPATQVNSQTLNPLHRASATQDPISDETIVQTADAVIDVPNEHSFNQFSLPRVWQDNSQALPLIGDDTGPSLETEETIVQTAPPETRHTVAQTFAQERCQKTYDELQTEPEGMVEETIVQYADAAIYNPADQTVAQVLTPMDEPSADQTICQQHGSLVQPAALATASAIALPKQQPQGRAIFQTIWQSRRNVTSLFVDISGRFYYGLRRLFDFRRWQSIPQLPAAGQRATKSAQPPTPNSAESKQPSPEQYQKSLQELDQCRLSFAKELARNGKFRDAIATAQQIPENSPLSNKAQKLIQNWQWLQR